MKKFIICISILSMLFCSSVVYAEPKLPKTRDVMPEGGAGGGGSSSEDKDEEENKDEASGDGNSFSQGEENSDGSLKHETSGDKQKLQDEFNKILWTYPEKVNSEIPIDSVLTVYFGLQAGGLNKYQTIGLMCNFIRETSLIPDVESTVSTNVGIGAWGEPRKGNLAKFSESCDDKRFTVHGATIGGLATQTAFAAAEAYTGEKTGPSKDIDYIMMNKAPKSKWLTKVNWSTVEALTLDKDVDFTKGLTKEIWDGLECPLACFLYAYVDFEMGEQGLDVMKRGGNQAIPLYNLLKDIKLEDATDMMGQENADDMATALVSAGLMDETEFVKWKTSTRSKLEFSDIQDMLNDDISDVENWKAGIEKQNSDSLLIRGGRWLTMLFGILFNVYMLLIYISYWFDRLNNFFDYSLLNILTLGKLTISPDEDQCTFSVTSLGKGEVRTVNHRKILEICIIGLAFGTLIISGVFFQILSGIVNKILEILY